MGLLGMEWEWGLGAWSHFGRSHSLLPFRFVNSCWLRAGGMALPLLWPVSREAQV